LLLKQKHNKGHLQNGNQMTDTLIFLGDKTIIVNV